ncbi:hypothetical protein [Radiobacillus sp. PE A8.2]
MNAIISNEYDMEFIILNEEQRKIPQQWSSTYKWSTRVLMKILRLTR